MRRFGIARLCLFAVVAASTVAASTAMAAEFGPERGTCKAAKAGRGKFLNSLCTEPGEKSGKGKEFEWIPAKEAAFTSTTGAATLYSFAPEGTELSPVACLKSNGKGKAGATTSTSVVTFEGCMSAGEKCTGGAKAKSGDIITFELEGTLGLVKPGEVGESLVGKGPGGLSSEFKCGSNEIKTKGSVIGIETPVNAKASKTKTLTFEERAHKQEPEKLDGGPKDTLETEIDGVGGGTFPFSSTESTTATVKGASVELRGAGAGAGINVLTLQKLGKKGGANAPVGDAVAVSLEKNTEVKFTKTENKEPGTLGGGAGVVSCSQSEVKGEIKSNPEVGKGSALIEIKSWTFANCKSTIGKAWKKTSLEEFPAFAQTFEVVVGGVTKIGFELTQGANHLQFGVELGIETATGGEEICAFRTARVESTYANLDSEVKINEALGEFGNVKECNPNPPTLSKPTWEAVYEPLHDKTGVNKGKPILINEKT